MLEVQHPISGLVFGEKYHDDAYVVFTKVEATRLNVLVHKGCGADMVRIISPVHVSTIVRGNSDYAAREKERLTKRANDHWNRKGRSEAIASAAAKGNPVPTPWLRKEVSRIK